MSNEDAAVNVKICPCTNSVCSVHGARQGAVFSEVQCAASSVV